MTNHQIGLTAEEARVAAGLTLAACFWKRVSELHLMAPPCTRDTGLQRRSQSSGEMQTVYEITAFGQSIARRLLSDGSVNFPEIPANSRSKDPVTSKMAGKKSKSRGTKSDSHRGRILLAYYDELNRRGSVAA